MENIAVPAHNRRYRNDVIDFHRVFQANDQPSAQDSQYAE